MDVLTIYKTLMMHEINALNPQVSFLMNQNFIKFIVLIQSSNVVYGNGLFAYERSFTFFEITVIKENNLSEHIIEEVFNAATVAYRKVCEGEG